MWWQGWRTWLILGVLGLLYQIGCWEQGEKSGFLPSWWWRQRTEEEVEDGTEDDTMIQVLGNDMLRCQEVSLLDSGGSHVKDNTLERDYLQVWRSGPEMLQKGNEILNCSWK